MISLDGANFYNFFVDDGEYHELRVYHPGKSHPQEKWHKVGEDGKDIKDMHDYNVMNNKFVNSFDPPPRSEKAKTGKNKCSKYVL